MTPPDVTAAELDSLQLPPVTDAYRLEERCGAVAAVERRRDMLDPGARVFISRMRDAPASDVGEALARVGAADIIAPGDPVAIKINLGGGVEGVPSSCTDLLVVEGVIQKVRELGGRPFVCEANMRSMTMDHRMLARRGLLPVLLRNHVQFINLSELADIDFYPLGWNTPISLVRALMHPGVKVISVPALKHHWECGLSLSQKNMYGAIAERQKSLFHRGGVIDETVAAAARGVTPDISVLAHRQVGGGLGPHFCIPINFGYVVASDNVMAADRVGCDFMGTDWREVKHLQINSGGREIPFRLVEGSAEIDRLTRDRVARTAIPRWKVLLWRALLYPQYFVPHKTQYRQIPKFEPVGKWANWLFCHTRGDAWPAEWGSASGPDV